MLIRALVLTLPLQWGPLGLFTLQYTICFPFNCCGNTGFVYIPPTVYTVQYTTRLYCKESYLRGIRIFCSTVQCLWALM